MKDSKDDRIERRDRRARRIEELSDAEMEAIAKAEVPAEYVQLDEELRGWRSNK